MMNKKTVVLAAALVLGVFLLFSFLGTPDTKEFIRVIHEQEKLISPQYHELYFSAGESRILPLPYSVRQSLDPDYEELPVTILRDGVPLDIWVEAHDIFDRMDPTGPTGEIQWRDDHGVLRNFITYSMIPYTNVAGIQYVQLAVEERLDAKLVSLFALRSANDMQTADWVMPIPVAYLSHIPTSLDYSPTNGLNFFVSME